METSLPTMFLPLSGKQKSSLARLAKTAYNRAKQHDLTDEKENDWRAREAVECCGKRISQAKNGDYPKLEAHFANLGGDTRRAMDALDRAETDEHRQAMNKLAKELAKEGLEISFAQKICKAANEGKTLEQVLPERVWKVMFTVRMRRAQNQLLKLLERKHMHESAADILAKETFDGTALQDLDVWQIRKLITIIKAIKL